MYPTYMCFFYPTERGTYANESNGLQDALDSG